MVPVARPETHPMTDLVPAAPPVDTPVAAPSRDERTVRLGDVGIARENLRFDDPPDDDIPTLAATMRAAGQLQRLTVRPGRGRKERPWMALDGRRRRLALGLRLEAGEIDEDHPVEVYVETDPARQAAAVLLTNTALPIHVADVIAAIGRMMKSRLTVEAIARALGYAEIDIRRLAALAGLPPVALEALKTGRITLKNARALTRLPDRKEQIDIAEQALAGYGFQDWRINDRLQSGRVTIRDRRCALVGPEAYAAAGGRTETDLFDELPAVLLDPDILSDLWLVRARRIARTFEAEGVEVHVTAGAEPDMPDDLEPLGHRSEDLTEAELAAWREARDACGAAFDAARDADLTRDDADALLIDLVRTRIAQDQAGVGGRVVTAVVVWPAGGSGLDVRCYSPVEPEREAEEGEALPAAEPPVSAVFYEPPRAAAPPVSVEGVKHALHAVRTDVATRGLIRALADRPDVALILVIARLFTVLVLRSDLAASQSATTIQAEAYGSRKDPAIETLDGVVRQRLDDRRAAWQASGETVLAWISLLPEEERRALLAELAAISLDLREARTDGVRRHARAQAAELADLCGADITAHWTPDAVFLRPHSRPQLLDMLVEMKAEDIRAASLKKEELVDWVAEQAAVRGWAPAALSWSAAGRAGDHGSGDLKNGEEDAGPGEASDEAPDDGPDEGPGGFIVTPAGEAALNPAAA